MQPGPAIIRCIILCWIGDHPARCEVGKFLGGVMKLKVYLEIHSTMYICMCVEHYVYS